VSQSAVIRVKKELQSTTDLMILVDVLKRVATAQFQILDDQRKQSGWTRTELPSEEGAADNDQPPREAEWGTAMVHSRRQGPPLSFTALLENFLRLIPPDGCRHPFFQEPSKPMGIVIITSNEGFLGGLNAMVIQKALSARGNQAAELIVIGERGKIYLKDLNERFSAFPGVGEHINAREVEGLRDYIVEQYLYRKFGTVQVFYPRCFSFTHWELDSFQLLPCSRAWLKVVSSDPAEPYLEPSAYSIVEYLIRLWLGRKLHEVFWQSRLSELAARANHLEASLQGLGEQKKKLTLQYFRSKHEITDTSIRESFAGVLSRKKRDWGVTHETDR